MRWAWANRRARSRAAILLAALAWAAPLAAFEHDELLGRWRWQKVEIEVAECAGGRLCATVVAGPKGVGANGFASEMTKRDGSWFGRIMDPQTGETYASRLSRTDSDRWRVDGCNDKNICHSGEFVRVR